MKKSYLYFFFLLATNYLVAQYTTIPDPNFELALIDQGIDTDGLNGYVLTDSINDLTEFNLYNSWVSDFIGIEDFTSLVNLGIFDNYAGINLNLSNNSNLKYFVCDHSGIESISFENNASIETVSFYETSGSNVNFTNATNLRMLDWTDALGSITMDISTNTNLRYLSSENSYLTNLNINNNLLLGILNCKNSFLSTLDISNNTLLEEVYCSYNNLVSLDISNNIALKEIDCSFNDLTILNAIDNTLLRVLNCSNNNLNSLNIQNGSNDLLNGNYSYDLNIKNRFNATNNPNLSCIFVDDVANCNANWLGIDASSHFVSTMEECELLSTSEFVKEDFIVFPNPVSTILNIENNSNKIINEINLYDGFGKLILSKEKDFDQLDVSFLANGFYFLTIQNEFEKKAFKILKK